MRENALGRGLKQEGEKTAQDKSKAGAGKGVADWAGRDLGRKVVRYVPQVAGSC